MREQVEGVTMEEEEQAGMGVEEEVGRVSRRVQSSAISRVYRVEMATLPSLSIPAPGVITWCPEYAFSGFRTREQYKLTQFPLV